MGKKKKHRSTEEAAFWLGELTGRDTYIICQALAYAIEAIDGLPAERQELSNQADMRVLLNHMTECERRDGIVAGVRSHLTGIGHASQRREEP